MEKFFYSQKKKYKKKLLILILFVINFILIQIYQKKEKKLRICLCIIGKKENLYAKEFIEHYKKLGYNKIFIYDNNDINDERFEEIIQDEINNGFVSIINYRGYKLPQQLSSYKDCYEKNNLAYNWLSFFDFDEYLELKPKNITIQNFLSHERYHYCQIIKINWICYSNYKNLYYDKKPIQQRFFSSIQPDKHIKSTVRGNLPTNYWQNAGTPHSSRNKFNSCSSSGKMIDFSSSFNDPPDIKYAFLKHYHYKSFEEFCIKLKRGKPDQDNHDLILRLKSFYQQNKYDYNKLNIMNKVFNLTL